MGHHQIKLILIFSALLSSCGLIDKFSSSDSSVDSTENTSSTSLEKDELFENTTSTAATSDEAHTDAPTNVTNEVTSDSSKDDFQSLQNEFSSDRPKESEIAEVKTAPLKIQETAPEINTSLAEAKIEMPTNGEVKKYKVQKGETLMQIAFKLYGDVSRWKEIKKLNGDKLSKNSSLLSNLSLKYIEPETPFVWNPDGNPYLIKNGETLGTISNSVYHTPKKWKTLWENNRPLIKNPNIIFAGFTLYYKGEEMANYVEPVDSVKKMAKKPTHTLNELEQLDSNTEEIKYTRSSTVREPAQVDLPISESTSPTLPPVSSEPEDEDVEVN